jgi:hypothetical protein
MPETDARQGASGERRDDAQRRPDDMVGSSEHLRASFARAAAAADRAVGVWLVRTSTRSRPGDTGVEHQDLRALRAVVRAAATAYARRLRAEGTAPERMVVLVKDAASHPSTPGFGARELTYDVVRWSIEAYFDA